MNPYERFRQYLVYRRPQTRSQSLTDRYINEEIMTGQPLVDRVVRAIELNQSVLLAGPRGCGKSWCISQAIKQAMERGIIPQRAQIFLQGNKEIPRDYLAEDQIAFKFDVKEGRREVIPEIRSAPLFVFAQRNEQTQEPVIDTQRRVQLKLSQQNGAPPRFVLFLDEINRFSDGLLDSLLSVLEERKAVLGGEEYYLPVVVCMTMNPPGYDASARRLSPPLAARINRSLSLKSPDLDTLQDIIVKRKLADLEREHEDNLLRVKDGFFYPEFPKVSERMVRLSCVVTLALWGDIREDEPSYEYLTQSTHALLEKLMAADEALAENMRWISRLCRFGPDGRAAADWLTSAVGLAIDEAIHLKDPTPTLSELHFRATARDTLIHKIYDDFSAASQPGKARQKIHSVEVIAQRIFKLRLIWTLVRRDVDDPNSKVWHDVERQKKTIARGDRLIDLLRSSRLTDDSEVRRLPGVFSVLGKTMAGSKIEEAMIRANFVEESRDGDQRVYPEWRYKVFFESLAEDTSNDLDATARDLLSSYGQQKIRLEDRLRQHEVADDVIGTETMLKLKRELKATAPDIEAVLTVLDTAWVGRPSLSDSGAVGAELATLQKIHEKSTLQEWSSQRRELLIETLRHLETYCHEQYERHGGRDGLFIVKFLDWLFRRQQAPEEALAWQVDHNYFQQLRKLLVKDERWTRRPSNPASAS
jgi:MoxR-like ATPase